MVTYSLNCSPLIFNMIEFASEDFIMSFTDWVFKVDRDLGLECLKKYSKNDPYKSEKILMFIKNQGGVKGCLKYMEYLTIECGLDDRPIHTEIACLYMQIIVNTLQKHVIVLGNINNNTNE